MTNEQKTGERIGAPPKYKPVHRAGQVNQIGQVSALCFKRPRPIDLKVASWTNRYAAVTCAACRKRMEKSCNGGSEYDRDVLRSADENHMWLNAFTCVKPTTELKVAIGEWVLRLLGDDECTILSSSCRGKNVMAGLDQRELVVRFNKS